MPNARSSNKCRVYGNGTTREISKKVNVDRTKKVEDNVRHVAV